jgi:hypothetical protein
MNRPLVSARYFEMSVGHAMLLIANDDLENLVTVD